MSIKVFLIINLWHLDSDFIRKWFINSLSSTDISRKHNLYLDTHDSLWKIDVSDGMINVIILWLTCGYKISLFIFLNFGSLLSKFSSNNNFTSFNLFNLHDVSYDEHSSRSRWSLLHHFGLKKFNLSTSR